MEPENPENLIDRVGLRITELRSQADLTQAQVAERLGMTLTNYQRIENGAQNATLRMMVRVANAIGVKTADLLAEPVMKKRGRGRPKDS